MLHNVTLQRLPNLKHFNLLVQFVSYKENEVLWIRTQGLYSQHTIFFVTYESAL